MNFSVGRFKVGDRVKVVRISADSPTVELMVGQKHEITAIERKNVWLKQLTGNRAGVIWVCYRGDLEPLKPLSSLERRIKRYIAAEFKELGI